MRGRSRRKIRTIERRQSHDRWLVSYAGFITLLFAFFVVMYSAAQLDKRRAGKLATAIQTAFEQRGSLPPKPADVGGLSSTGVPSNLPIGNTEDDEFRVLKGLREVGFFDSGSDQIKASSAGAFARLALVLRQANSDLRIEGHTDNIPIHNARFSSNWDLSTTRATATIRLLIQQYGFIPQRLSASGYAEYRPTSSNDTSEGRAMNRRVDVVIPRARGIP